MPRAARPGRSVPRERREGRGSRPPGGASPGPRAVGGLDAGGNVSDSLSALFVVLLGSVSYATSSGVRDAKACLSCLDGYDARVRALRDDVPETDSTAPPGLLERWERIAAELDEKHPLPPGALRKSARAVVAAVGASGAQPRRLEQPRDVGRDRRDGVDALRA